MSFSREFNLCLVQVEPRKRPVMTEKYVDYDVQKQTIYKIAQLASCNV